MLSPGEKEEDTRGVLPRYRVEVILRTTRCSRRLTSGHRTQTSRNRGLVGVGWLGGAFGRTTRRHKAWHQLGGRQMEQFNVGSATTRLTPDLQLRVSAETFEGHRVAQVRYFKKYGSKWLPTHKGIASRGAAVARGSPLRTLLGRARRLDGPASRHRDIRNVPRGSAKPWRTITTACNSARQPVAGRDSPLARGTRRSASRG